MIHKENTSSMLLYDPIFLYSVHFQFVYATQLISTSSGNLLSDMQKVENLPPADFQVNIFRKWAKSNALEHMNFRHFF